jgi:hypothetical protein
MARTPQRTAVQLESISTRHVDVIRGRAATIEASWRRHGGRAAPCGRCITEDHSEQPCDCLCRRCTTSQHRARLTGRADTYARDARKFRDAGKLGQPILSAAEDAHWASVFQAIADELRNIAADPQPVTR